MWMCVYACMYVCMCVCMQCKGNGNGNCNGNGNTHAHIYIYILYIYTRKYMYISIWILIHYIVIWWSHADELDVLPCFSVESPTFEDCLISIDTIPWERLSQGPRGLGAAIICLLGIVWGCVLQRGLWPMMVMSRDRLDLFALVKCSQEAQAYGGIIQA